MRAEDEWMGKPGLCATVRVLRMAFFRKVITRHDTGLGEAYMDGDFLVRLLCSDQSSLLEHVFNLSNT